MIKREILPGKAAKKRVFLMYIASYLGLKSALQVSKRIIFLLTFFMTNTALVKDMLDNAVHIGYKRQYWSPKMRDYIFGTQNGIHVFDLFKTADKLEELKTLLGELAAKGKEILFVGTKVQAQEIIKNVGFIIARDFKSSHIRFQLIFT